MTSGEFHSIPVASITVNRGDRQRRELKNIEELAESINRIGLIHPPVVTRDHVLVAGERRLSAIKMLGHTSVPVQYVDELDPLELHVIELEENVKRVDLSWQDQVLAMQRYHELRARQQPGWSMTDTAKAIGATPQEVSQKILVATEIAKGNELVTKADKFTTAKNIVTRDNSRKAVSAVKSAETQLTSLLGEEPEPEPTARPVPLLNEDFHEWASGYCGQPFNFIHCDFPYGVNMHKSGQGANQSYGSYADEEDVYWKLISSLELAMSNVVADSAHLMFWYSMDYHQITMERLTAMGWRVNPFPLIWFKNDNTGIIPDAQRGPRRVYETCLIASRGDRLLTARGAKSNLFAHPGKDKSIHMNEKPVPMLRHFMEMFVDEYSLVLDPTAGSANALKAATALGAPTVLGLERDPEFFARSTEAYWIGPEDSI